MERFTLYWIDAEVTIEAGALLAVGSGAHIYGGVDWVSMAMSADETADLTKPEVGSSQWHRQVHPSAENQLPLQWHAYMLLRMHPPSWAAVCTAAAKLFASTQLTSSCNTGSTSQL
jgi:hypothetical protein